MNFEWTLSFEEKYEYKKGLEQRFQKRDLGEPNIRYGPYGDLMLRIFWPSIARLPNLEKTPSIKIFRKFFYDFA